VRAAAHHDIVIVDQFRAETFAVRTPITWPQSVLTAQSGSISRLGSSARRRQVADWVRVRDGDPGRDGTISVRGTIHKHVA
jgi:hypothetical protein